MIYVLFGPPGVGKTYVGKLLSKNCGLSFFDADNLIDDTEKILIRSGKYNLTARLAFFRKVIEYLSDIYPKKFDDLVVAQAFTQEKSRQLFLDSYKGQVKFLLVKCSRNQAKRRIEKRYENEKHVITPDVFDLIWNEFELPQIEHKVIMNEKESDKDIIGQLKKIIK